MSLSRKSITVESLKDSVSPLFTPDKDILPSKVTSDDKNSVVPILFPGALF
ncbi:MAG: hypothetical protein AB4080_24610 [Trichodesmium sp.]